MAERVMVIGRGFGGGCLFCRGWKIWIPRRFVLGRLRERERRENEDRGNRD
jgi:hypothetical protein